MADLLKATPSVPSSFAFDGRRIRPGDQFLSDSPRMTQILLQLGFAEAVEQPEFAATPTYTETFSSTTRALESVVRPEKRKRGRPKGSYKRRDLRAEG